MASSKQKHDMKTLKDVTTCPICFEQFKRPKYLMCLHSFCEVCLKTYISSTYEKDNSIIGIHCPVCRGFVSKPNNVTWRNWADSMHVNHFLTSIIDLSHVDPESKSCDVCARENETKSAISWCGECREAFCKSCDHQHRRFDITLIHNITQLTDLQLESQILPRTATFCSEHPDRKLEVYCTDHTSVCCLTCTMLKHRKCENVGTIEDAAKEKRYSSEVDLLQKSFSDMKVTLERMKEDLNRFAKILQTNTLTMKNDIVAFSLRLLRYIESLTKNAEDEVTAVEKQHLPGIEARREDIVCKLAAVEHDKILLETSITLASDAHFLTNLSKLTEQRSVLEEFIRNQKRNMKCVEAEFKICPELKALPNTINKLGTLVVSDSLETSEPISSVTLDLLNASPIQKLVFTIDDCVEGIALLQDEHILLSVNQTLRLLTKDGTFLSELYFEEAPLKIAMANDTKGAVVLEDKCLLYFKIDGNKIVEEGRLECHCGDIAVNSGLLFIGIGSQVIVLDEARKLLKVIGMDKRIWAIDCFGENLVFSSDADDVLRCVTTTGKKVFEYSHKSLVQPYGVTVDKRQNIYVCGRQSKNVHQLLPDGKLNKVIFENLPSGPLWICFNETNDTAAIGCEDSMHLYAF